MDNLERLTERINRTSNPRCTLTALAFVLTAAKGDFDNLTPEAIYRTLNAMQKGGQAG